MKQRSRHSSSLVTTAGSLHWIPALAAIAALALLLAQGSWAQGNGDADGDEGTDDETETEFEEAQLFFELNNTDNDLGIQGSVDGGPWTRLEIESAERRLMSIRAAGPLWSQQLTEFFFESAEPSFDELSPDQLFKRFPAGTYEISGSSRDIGELESEVEVEHVMPAAPAPVTINGVTVVRGGTPVDGNVPEDWPAHCDSPVEEYVEVPRSDSLAVDWDPVTSSHAEIGESGDVEIVSYEVVMEAEFEVGPAGEAEEFVSIFSVLLPPDITEMAVPQEFIGLTEPHEPGVDGAAPPRTGAEFLKVEVLARDANGNRTAVEGCFTLTDAT